MGLLEGVGKAEGALAFWERVLKWGPVIIGTTATSAITGWATSATKLLEEYAPLAWIGGAVLGGTVFLIGAAALSYARVNAARLEYFNDQKKAPDSINPLEETFNKKRINVQSLRSQFNEPVEGKTFVDCELCGPAVIALLGNVSMSGVGIGNCEFVRVRNGAAIYNAIPFQNLTVNRGKMRGLTILVPEGAVAKVDSGVRGIQWVTHSSA